MNRIGTGKLRDLNDQIILKLLLRHQEVTKKELANYSRLTVATVGTILNDFLDNGTVVEKEIIYLKKGRFRHRTTSSSCTGRTSSKFFP